MDDKKIHEAAEKFVNLPTDERIKAWNKLDAKVKPIARAMLEKRRGIAYRLNGIPVLTAEEYDNQIARLEAKLDMFDERKKALRDRISVLRKEKQLHWGSPAKSNK